MSIYSSTECNEMKFIIVSPRNNGGGAIVLHALCKYLNELGCDAKIFYVSYYGRPGSFFFWYKWVLFTIKDLWMGMTAHVLGNYFPKKYRAFVDFPISDLKRKFWPSVDRDTVVVYPDVAIGNFLRAKNVVRYLLYYSTYKEGDIDKKKDLVICYRLEFNDWELNPDGKVVHCPFFNIELYKQTNFGERKGTCYVIHKGKNRPDLPKEFDGIIVDDLTEKEKVKVFNQCERCISYDTQTAYSRIAALCGCLSIIVPERDKSISNYRNQNDTRYGIAIGFDETQKEYALQTKEKLYAEMNEISLSSRKSVEKFLQYCIEFFE